MFTCAYHSAHFTWMGQGLCVIKIYRHRSLYYWKPFIMRGPIYSGLSKMTFTTQVICPFKYRCDPYLSVSWLVAFREYVGTKTTLFSFKTKLEKIAAAIVLWFKCVFYFFIFSFEIPMILEGSCSTSWCRLGKKNVWDIYAKTWNFHKHESGSW